MACGLVLAGAVAAAGCGAGPSSPANATGSDGGADGAALGPEAFQISTGPIDVGAGVEKTVCMVKDLGNTEDLVVTGFTASLAPGSHHLILYKTTEPESLTPATCAPFVGLDTGQALPIVLANKPEVTWSFPNGVGLEVHAHQMVRIEAHYINAGATDLQGQGTVSFRGTPRGAAPPFQPAEFAFWGMTNFTIPPGSNATAGPTFQPGIAGTHLISIVTHQHELGTGVRAWASAAPGDMSTPVVNDTDWANPSWRALDPAVDFDGTNGLTYQCDWYNPTSSSVTFGETAHDEMCFVGGFYYPAPLGFDLCLDGQCLIRPDGGLQVDFDAAAEPHARDAGAD